MKIPVQEHHKIPHLRINKYTKLELLGGRLDIKSLALHFGVSCVQNYDSVDI